MHFLIKIKISSQSHETIRLQNEKCFFESEKLYSNNGNYLGNTIGLKLM